MSYGRNISSCKRPSRAHNQYFAAPNRKLHFVCLLHESYPSSDSSVLRVTTCAGVLVCAYTHVLTMHQRTHALFLLLLMCVHLQDVLNGKGTFTYASGSSYTGSFVAGKYHGEGKYEWPNGTHYIGSWQEGVMHGDGTYTDVDGREWSGHFFNGTGPGLQAILT